MQNIRRAGVRQQHEKSFLQLTRGQGRRCRPRRPNVGCSSESGPSAALRRTGGWGQELSCRPLEVNRPHTLTTRHAILPPLAKPVGVKCDAASLSPYLAAARRRCGRARARAQRQALPVIGFLNVGTRSDSDMALPGLRQGLREAGFIEG
jgi:hypothetical protein